MGILCNAIEENSISSFLVWCTDKRDWRLQKRFLRRTFLHSELSTISSNKKWRTEVTKNTTAKDRMKAWDSSLDIIPENGQPTLHDGSRTFGLVLDKEYNLDKALDTPKGLTLEQEELLGELRTTLISARVECNDLNTQFLRINLVKGACTTGHTDNFKNFLLLSEAWEASDTWDPEISSRSHHRHQEIAMMSPPSPL